MVHWGHIDSVDDAKLAAAAGRFKKRMKVARSQAAAENEVRRFMKEYLAIGEDPTDTVIRDKVWLFLLKTTKGKVSPEELDRIWTTEVGRHGSCVVS